MRRFPVRTAAVFACALATTGCASLGLDDSAADAGHSQAAMTAETASKAPYDNLINKQGTNLDGEIRRAQLMRVQGNYAGAVHVLSQLMLVAPDDPRVVGEYGKTLAQQGRSSDALAFLTRAIELQPDNWTLYSALGVTDDQLNKRRDAETAYKHALALKPGDPTVLNNYAVSQMLAGNLDRAEELLNQAAAHGGAYPKIAANRAMIAQMRAEQAKAAGPESAVKPAPKTAVAKATRPAMKHAHVAVKPMHSVAKISQPEKPPMASAKGPRPLQPRLAAKVKMMTGAPRIVMEKVPHDPLAGKVYGRHGAAPVHIAKAKPVHKTEHVAKAKAKQEAKTASVTHKSSIPALRTAADLY